MNHRLFIQGQAKAKEHPPPLFPLEEREQRLWRAAVDYFFAMAFSFSRSALLGLQ